MGGGIGVARSYSPWLLALERPASGVPTGEASVVAVAFGVEATAGPATSGGEVTVAEAASEAAASVGAATAEAATQPAQATEPEEAFK